MSIVRVMHTPELLIDFSPPVNTSRKQVDFALWLNCLIYEHRFRRPTRKLIPGLQTVFPSFPALRM